MCALFKSLFYYFVLQVVASQEIRGKVQGANRNLTVLWRK